MKRFFDFLEKLAERDAMAEFIYVFMFCVRTIVLLICLIILVISLV